MISPIRRTVAQQLADLLRGQIDAGSLRPGEQIPTEATLMHTYDVSRTTVRNALALLRHAGLIETRHPHGTFVLAEPERTPVALQRGSRILVRMPTPLEREELSVGDGVAVMVVQHGAKKAVYPCDRHVFTVA